MFLISFLVFILGAVIGSGINCLVERRIAGRSWWRGRSACPQCQRALTWYELLPVISFLALRGRCRTCGCKLNWQYLLSEVFLGGFFVLAWQRSGLDLSVFSGQNFWPLLIVLRDWVALSFLAAIFWYDYREKMIPDAWSFLGGALALSFNIFLGLSWYQILLGGAVISGFLGLQYIISKGRWIGLGDVKLGIFLGFLLGWPQVLAAIFLAYLLGGSLGGYLLLRKKVTPKTAIPLGPFLTLATAIVLLYGQSLIDWYLRSLGV